uniref:Uncharacterized protein n=1 Tax=Rhizophora mucronata TaxID=61149 RepID=A0A2P2IT40_RHIMU
MTEENSLAPLLRFRRARNGRDPNRLLLEPIFRERE